MFPINLYRIYKTLPKSLSWRPFLPGQGQGNVDGLAQEIHNSIANTLELRLSCTKPSMSSSVYYVCTVWPSNAYIYIYMHHINGSVLTLVLVLLPIRHQAITWANVDPDLCHNKVSPWCPIFKWAAEAWLESIYRCPIFKWASEACLHDRVPV